MQYTEYKVISIQWPFETKEDAGSRVNRVAGHEAVLNDLGRLGWELVSVTHVPATHPEGTARNVLVLGRPLRDS